MPTPAYPSSAQSEVSLAGNWRCALDPSDQGITERWFAGALEGSVATLPGSLDVQGIGEQVSAESAWTATVFDRAYFDSPDYARYREPGNVKVPYWLQPETRYVGPAWYQRVIEVPESWKGKHVTLFLERPHWRTLVWLDNDAIGGDDSLSTPHSSALGAVAPGRYRLTIRVDNRLHTEIGENAHSISDHTQGNWNGVIGRIELQARGPVSIEHLDVTPDVETRSIRVRGEVRRQTGADSGDVDLRVRRRESADSKHGAVVAQSVAPVRWAGERGNFETQLDLGPEAPLWDEFSPELFELEAKLDGARRTTVFGLRAFSTEGRHFLINGRRVFLRGALDCCIFPLTGHPPMEVAAWRDLLRRIRSYGINHIRFHSWCPPEAAFTAGDELGFYFQVECPVWPNGEAVLGFNSPHGIGDGKAVDHWAFVESKRILRAYGNHPCFVLMACGNEPGGRNHRSYLSGWVNHFRTLDRRRLYTGAAGWPELEENQFHVIPDPRLHQWSDGLKSRLNAEPPSTLPDYRAVIASREVPVISHEIGQWSAYPSIYDTAKYRGHLKARNHEIFAENLAAHHLADQAESFVHASGKLQTLCYKEEIEAALRTPDMAGFQLLGLQDFPGQGTSPVGVLDAFWDEKGYQTASEMRRFCGSTIPLVRLPKRIFTTNEELQAAVEVAHFGDQSLLAANLSWQIACDDGSIVRQGAFPLCEIPVGNGQGIGHLRADLSGLSTPARYTLEVCLDVPAVSASNAWDIWLFPTSADTSVPAQVVFTVSLSDALSRLEEGRNVLCMPALETIAGDVALGFTPIFWNRSCTQGQAPDTLGILCDPHHPALAQFPTASHTDWQWWHLIAAAQPMVLDGLPADCRPIVQVIDDWYSNRRLGLLLEARVGAGRLILCSIDLASNSASREDTVVRQQLLRSLLDYAASASFQPVASLARADLETLFQQRS